MKSKSLVAVTLSMVLPLAFIPTFYAQAEESVDAFELVYDEKEEGVDFYTVKFTVSDRFIRIDDSSTGGVGGHDKSTSMNAGYIVFDLDDDVIYSVSHFDRSILVIPKYPYTIPDQNIKTSVIYEPLKDSPSISGKQVFNYKVIDITEAVPETCMDIQLASGLWPEVTARLQRYQAVIAGQQMKNIVTTPEEYRTPCLWSTRCITMALIMKKDYRSMSGIVIIKSGCLSR